MPALFVVIQPTVMADSNLTTPSDPTSVTQPSKKVKEKNHRVHFEPGHAHHFPVIRSKTSEEEDQRAYEESAQNAVQIIGARIAARIAASRKSKA